MKKILTVSTIMFLLSCSASFAYSYVLQNKVPDMKHPIPYTEVCFKERATKVDIHDKDGPTSGGHCLPGDVGFIIERKERPKLLWVHAIQTCATYGMRLPTFFELQLSCFNRNEWALKDMINNWEWASNQQFPISIHENSGSAVAILGYSGCGHSVWDWVGYNKGANYQNSFRCAR